MTSSRFLDTPMSPPALSPDPSASKPSGESAHFTAVAMCLAMQWLHARGAPAGARLDQSHTAHKPPQPNNDVPDEFEPGSMPVEPDQGPLPTGIPEEPEQGQLLAFHDDKLASTTRWCDRPVAAPVPREFHAA